MWHSGNGFLNGTGDSIWLGGVAHRQDYAGLTGIDAAASCFKMSHLDKPSSELLNCVRDGTFFLNTIKAKYDVTNDGLSPHCERRNTLEHRALHIRRYFPVRIRFLDAVNMWWSLSTCLTHHGLAPMNPWQQEFCKQLAELYWEPPPWMHVPAHTGLQR